jgi:uncharacterized protein CbrC (UPF0167 family)
MTITCQSCGQAWLAAFPLSLYEQQAVESSPCPHCGAYTLCCRQADESRAPQRRALLETQPVPVRP